MIDEVTIGGAHKVDEDEILEKIATEPTPRLLGLRLPWTARSLLDTHVLERDIRRITRLYQARGFYDARVESMQIVPDDDEVDIRIEVDEGYAVRVRTLTVTGHQSLPARPRRAVERAVELAPGDRFDEEKYDRTRESIVRELRARGYARAAVQGHVTVHADTRQAEVTFLVSPGPIMHFRNITVRGLEDVAESRVIVAMDIDRGDTFSDKALESAQSALFGLGVFERVQVRPVISPNQPIVDLEVDVAEADFRRFRAGGGFSLDNTRWDLHATTGWEHRNLFGGLQLLRITWKPGVSFSPSIFKPTNVGIDTEADVDFVWPGFPERRTTLLHHGAYKVGNDTTPGAESQCRHDVRTSVGLARPLASWLRGTISQEVQYYRPVDDLLFLTCPPQSRGTPYSRSLLSYLNETLVIDLRDDPLRTRRGGYISLSLSESAPGVISDAGFLEIFQDARVFVPLQHRLGLAGRLGLGRSFPYPENTVLPASLRFFSGGASSVRGYTTNTIGAYSCPDPEERCISVGGDVKWEASIEARYQALSFMRLVAFLDVGDSYLPLFNEKLDLARHHASVGGGVRFDTPLGPVRIDIAARLPSKRRPQEDLAPIHIFVDLPVALHIALGDAF